MKMIDTIALKYHQVQRNYPLILKRVFLLGRTDKKMRYAINNQLIAGKVMQSMNCFVKIPSSGYEISFFYDENQDILNVSLSIPKYYYGQNVSQHINQSIVELDNQVKYQLYLIHQFISDFNRDILNCPVAGEDIEIVRLDFCFNMIFPNKLTAMQFLQYVKESRVRYLGDRSNLYVYQTSIQYRGDGYSWKFYHKGTEVKNKVEPGIQIFADRIMRFEVTLRRRKMSYIVCKMFPERDQPDDSKVRFWLADVYSYPNITMGKTIFETIANWYLEKFLELIPIENYAVSFNMPRKIRAILTNGGIKNAVDTGIICKRTAQRYRAYIQTINKDLLKTKLDFDITYLAYIQNAPIFGLNQVKSVKLNSI